MDADNLYWSQVNGDIWRAQLDGGGLEKVATSAGVGDLALDDDFLYWI